MSITNPLMAFAALSSLVNVIYIVLIIHRMGWKIAPGDPAAGWFSAAVGWTLTSLCAALFSVEPQ